ncbi:hypothetical protein Btru_066083 [Bulinus truncatus]|nr:hypothetical protein Btru_066083 [Bulinus truncatus]
MPNSRQPRPLGLDTKPAVKSKAFNEFNKTRSHKMADMSPEAKKAMFLTKMETKENAKITQVNLTKTLKSKGPMSNNMLTGLDHQAEARHSRPAPSSFDSGINVTTTTPSRSTLSYTTKTFSVSDHNDSCDNFGESSRNNVNSGLGRHSKVMAQREGGDHSASHADFFKNARGREDGPNGQTSDSEKDCVKETVDDNENYATNTDSMFPRSFVLALDRALEQQCIRRLQGDITDTVGISEKGKVRALNGGRLANAQEVVVNVCHEDDKEIVFHDDDDESLDTAKTISHIRVNIWMEFNEDFEPEHDTASELDYPTIISDKVNISNPKEPADLLKVTSKERKASRERNAKSSLNKNLAKNPKSTNSTNGKDSNNNTRSIGSSRSKTGTNLSSLDASSKNGSVFTEDSKFSKTWSKKSETGFRRLAQKRGSKISRYCQRPAHAPKFSCNGPASFHVHSHYLHLTRM